LDKEEEEEVVLERATFEFSQGANCLSNRDDFESLIIEWESDLGIDRTDGGFYVLKTEKWSINDEKDLKLIFDRIQKLIGK
jgi:hypothetical protein